MELIGFLVVTCVAGIVLVTAPGPDRPDITMLYKENRQICVAGSNTNGYGLAFMSETVEDSVHINRFEYRNDNGETIKSSSDCDFEQRPGDSCWIKWHSNDIILGKSGAFPISPIIDERWNNFNVYHIKNNIISEVYNITQETFFIGISVRYTSHAFFYLDPRYRNRTATKINKDFMIFINKITSNSSMAHMVVLKNENVIWLLNETISETFDESQWTHFLLSKESGNRIRLWLWDLDTGARPLLDYTEDNPISRTSLNIFSFATADVKVHAYQYANIVYRSGLIQLGPSINFVQSSSICLSLYVIMCSKCKMNIKLEKRGGSIEMATSIEGNSDGPFMTWRNIKLKGGISTSSYDYYQLYATLDTTDGSDGDTFWAIDDFRKCFSNVIRVASTNSSHNLTCYSLNHPNWKFNPNKRVEKHEPLACSDVWYIGQHCNISCFSVIPNDGCDGHKICMSTQKENNIGACTCAAGYMWGSNGCTQPCSDGYYGYNCENMCGRCKNKCYVRTGKCPQGCEDGYLPPYCQTSKSDITNDELPDTIFTSNLSARSCIIHWIVKQQEPIYFQIVLKCVQDEWCDQIPNIDLDNINSLKKEYAIYGLTPFTHYWVELRARRSQIGNLTIFSRTIEFYSLAENPPAVRNATYYSKNNTSISLRWLDPYPPYGHLEKYAIKYCFNFISDCATIEITTNQLAPCDLWNEYFNCYKLTNLYMNHQYTITITAKNIESTKQSPKVSFTVYTAEDKSSAPLNLTREWENNEIKLSWNHPDITNGELKKFIITLNETETKPKNQDRKPFYRYEYLVSEEKKIYNYKIKTYQHSSSYLVTVGGVNSIYGENATLHIDTPPETPELSGNITIDEQSVTAVTVSIPSVNNKTKNYVSFLYVVVSKINNSILETNSNETNKLKQEILLYSSYKHAWIAKEIIELNEKENKVFLGNNESTKSQELNDTIINYKLEPATEYEITLVLINRYKNESSTNVYRRNVRTASKFRAEFFALFSLFLLPVAVAIFFCFRKFRSRPKSREEINNPIELDGYLEPNTLVRNMYLEIVDNEPLCNTSDTQNTTLVQGHIYETIIYSTKNPPSDMNLLSEDVPIDEE